MSSDRAIGRYRRWYERLLRLYPRPFQERFAKPMAQTFADLRPDLEAVLSELYAGVRVSLDHRPSPALLFEVRATATATGR
jgi:hypothetical protein